MMAPSSLRSVVLLWAGFAFWGGAVALAVDPVLEVTLEPRTFGVEDVASLNVRILEPDSDPAVDLGVLVNLEVVAGPSTKTELSWVNGAATRAVSFTYVVQALEAGNASLGPVSVRMKSGELRSEKISVEVVPGSVAPQRSRGQRPGIPVDPFGDFFQRRQPARSARAELRHLLDRDRVVLGQPVIASVVLDTTAGGVDGFEWSEAPSYPGWWAQRIDPPDRIASEVVEVDGARYNRFVVVSHVLVPLKEGELEIPEVGARIGFRSAGLFGPQQVVERSSRARTVTVSPRPSPPEGFSGAVGDLRYRAVLEPEHIAFGESAVLSIELEGQGNLPLVEAPALWPHCEGCESYPPEEESSIEVDGRGIHGSRVWRTTLVPRTWGDLELQPVKLAVFDPASGRYRHQTLGPLRLTVEAPPATPTPAAETESFEDQGGPSHREEDSASGGGQASPPWAWILPALVAGLMTGGAVSALILRRRRVALPPRREGESPAERARQLQVALERWWLDARATARGRSLEDDLHALRKELEAVRFAPGRADHSETVSDLEDRLRGLMRRA